MPTDPRIDAYIEQAPPFARPILEHLREVVHCALPQAAETIKWSMPHFTLNGQNVAGMAAFKAHAAFVIHSEGRLLGEGLRGPVENSAMGQLGRLVTLADLPTALIGPFFERVQRIATVMPAALGCDGTFVANNNIVSQSVAHLHVHVVPRRRKDGLRGFFWPRQRYEPDEAEAFASMLHDALRNA